MVTPIRRPRPPRRRPAFSLRQLSLSFGLLAIAVTGVGLTLQKAMASASAHPGLAMGVGLVVVVALALLLRRGRRRRATARRLPAGRTCATCGGVAGERVLVPLGEPVGPSAVEEPDAPTTEDAGPRPVVDVDPRPVVDVDPRPPEIDDYAEMDADAFEEAVAGLCERDGCEDVRVVGGANDLGADVVAVAPDGRSVVIQCKRYGADNKVGSQELQRFGGTCFTVHGADVAAVVTTSAFTDPAREYAEQCAILCFDHDDLVGWASGTGPAPWE
ncbi:restriction endonuclease, partial [Streptomyces sp. NRRL S-1448]|uniref:restriction endonuclease n=1 Tax=Streptomyces sp. NRRL S-1448 TaxID=1463883 RepID=UPI0004C1146F